MPPFYDKPTADRYDYVVLGGGSGGSASSVCSSRLRNHYLPDAFESVVQPSMAKRLPWLRRTPTWAGRV